MNTEHELDQELESLAKEAMKNRCLNMLSIIQKEIALRTKWIQQRETQRERLLILAHMLKQAYTEKNESAISEIQDEIEALTTPKEFKRSNSNSNREVYRRVR